MRTQIEVEPGWHFARSLILLYLQTFFCEDLQMPDFERDLKLRVYASFASVSIAAVMTVLVPTYGWVGFAVIVAGMLGAYLIVRSKLRSKFRTREVMEWGSRKMKPSEKRSYFLGYCLIAISIGLLILQRSGLNL